MTIIQYSFSLNDVVTAVVPEITKSVEKVLQPKLDSIDDKFVVLEASLKAHTKLIVSKAADELALMVGKGFNDLTERVVETNKKIDKIVWRNQLLA